MAKTDFGMDESQDALGSFRIATINANDKHTNGEFVQSKNIFNICVLICRVVSCRLFVCLPFFSLGKDKSEYSVSFHLYPALWLYNVSSLNLHAIFFHVIFS